MLILIFLRKKNHNHSFIFLLRKKQLLYFNIPTISKYSKMLLHLSIILCPVGYKPCPKNRFIKPNSLTQAL